MRLNRVTVNKVTANRVTANRATARVSPTQNAIVVGATLAVAHSSSRVAHSSDFAKTNSNKNRYDKQT